LPIASRVGTLPAMKIVTCVGLVALVGCAHESTRVVAPAATPAAPATASGPSEPGPAKDAGAAAEPGAVKIDRSGSMEQQLARLQDAYDRNAEAVAFLNKVYGQQKAQQAEQERGEIDPGGMFAVDISGELKAGQVDGPASAPVTIVKAFDFACPFCSQAAPVMTELVAEYHGKVRVVYANMVVHPPAMQAHLASCAAAKQGKYKQFKDAFWAKGFAAYAAAHDVSKLGDDNILSIARGIGLDPVKLKTDMASPECKARIESDMTELAKFHVNGTPTFFVNGKPLTGALPKEEFKSIIDEQLAIVEGSGVPGADYYIKVVLAKGDKQFRSKADPKH
jgi:protein-disulfide isomerase